MNPFQLSQMLGNQALQPPAPQIDEKEEEFKQKIRHFFETFSILMKETKEKHLQKYYDEGIYIITEIDNMKQIETNEKFQIKDKILNSLLLLFPERCELYYFTACIYKNIDMIRHLSWLHICLDKNPRFVENVLDIIKVYFNMNKTEIIDNLNKKYNNFIYGNTDPRVQLSCAAVFLKTHRKKSAKDLLEAIQFCKTFSPDLQVIFYITIIRLYLELSTSDVSIYYINKCIDFCSKTPDIKKDILRTFYDNTMITFDYFYYNQTDRENTYNIFKQVHSAIPACDKMSPLLEEKVKMIVRENTDENTMIATQPIKIGYVSSDMVSHAVSRFIIPILENHSAYFEIYCFTKNENIYLPKIKKCIPIGEMTAIDAANKIQEMGIDILVDLNGYTNGNRLDVFEYTPAPIQVTYLGYPNSLYLDYIHYRITDTIADHETSSQKYTEKLVKLPGCFLLYKETFPRNHFRMKKTGSSPVILGSLNKESKINTDVLNLWQEIMEENPNTKIIIKLDTIADENVERMEFYKEKLNVDESRIILVDYMKEDIHYMELFKEVDILLDTFPYSGTTTTCNALYFSVPVITLYNKDYHAHCVSASVLINSELPEFVAYTREEYKMKVNDLCNNSEKLEHYRGGFISEKFDSCMDTEKFMAGYEKGLLQLYLHAFQTRNVAVE